MQQTQYVRNVHHDSERQKQNDNSHSEIVISNTSLECRAHGHQCQRYNDRQVLGYLRQQYAFPELGFHNHFCGIYQTVEQPLATWALAVLQTRATGEEATVCLRQQWFCHPYNAVFVNTSFYFVRVYSAHKRNYHKKLQ